MKRRRLRRIDAPGTARFLTFTCYRRLPLFLNKSIADLFAQSLTDVTTKQNVSVFCWVVMPNHVHLIVFPKDRSITMTRFTDALKGPFARRVINRWRTLDAAILPRLRHADVYRFWQTGGGFDRNVIGAELIEKIRYVHANPLRWKLADRPCDYRWSSAAAYDALPCIGPPIDFTELPRPDRPLT